MPYIDGFVIAVPTANKEEFLAHARQFDPMFLEFGATRVVEGWGDDVPHGERDRGRRPVRGLRPADAGGEQRHELRDEERIPVGALEHGLEQGRGRRRASEGFHQVSHGGLREAT